MATLHRSPSFLGSLVANKCRWSRHRRHDMYRVHVETLEDRRLLTAIALNDVYQLIQGHPLVVTASGVTANDNLASGMATSVVSNSTPGHGSLTINGDGTFTYTPETGYSGSDLFDYTITDGLGNFDTGTVALNILASSATEASIFAGPRLASVNTSQGALLNGLVGGLLGTNLTLTAVDWNSLAQSSINAADFIDALQADLVVGSTAEALGTEVTLVQLLDAAATAALAEGQTVLASILDDLRLDVAGLVGTVRLGDLLQVDLNETNLADVQLNALDLISGEAQLFNYENVATTPSPVTISGSSIGLGSFVNSIELSAQVVEPPVYVIGQVGTQFHTAAIRLALNLDLVDIDLDTNPLLSALLGPLQAVVGPLVSVETDARIGQISLYMEIASGSGTLTVIDALNNAVTIQATQGVASLYLGSVSDALFYNRDRPIVPATDVVSGLIGNLEIDVSLLSTPLINASAGIAARGVAVGSAPLSESIVFNGPYPETATVGSSASFVSNLLNTLATSLQISINGSLGTTLDGLANSVILPVLRPIVTNVLAPALGTVLTSLIDPTLDLLGVGIGEMDVTVEPLSPDVSPIANTDYVGTDEDAPVVISVLGDDVSVPANSADVVSVTQPSNGVVTVNPDGTITYTPNANFNGMDSFTYTIADSDGSSSTATVFVQVRAVNDTPVARPDAYSIAEDETLIVPVPGVLINDTDVDNDTLTVTLVTGPTNGVISLSPDGSFVYTPSSGYTGTDTFTYQASDGLLSSDVVTVTIVVGVSNAPPVANPDNYTIGEDGSLVIADPGVLSNDTDGDADTLTAVLVAGPNHGILSLELDGSFTYTPNGNFSGTDTFTYQASDGVSLSAPTTVTITVTGINDPPVANPDAYTINEDAKLRVTGPGVLLNDSDVDGDPLIATLVSGPANGSLVFNVDGSFTYTPNGNFSGTDTFTYQASDGSLSSGIATVTITVNAVNDPPVASPDNYTVVEEGTLTVSGPGVLANDIDVEGSTLTATLVSGPSNGAFALNPDGSFTYTPNPNFSGTDSFMYQASDGSSLSEPVLVTITVIGVNDAPVANPDAYSINEDGVLNVPGAGVLGNDTDVDGDPLTATVVTQPTNGTLTLNPDGSFTYSPNPNFNGTDTFTYQASDGTLTSAPVSVTITVNAVNDAPVANPDSYTVNENNTLTVGGPGVLSNDTDVEGTGMAAVLVSGPSHGTLTLNFDGSFTYVPNTNFSGADTFMYQASDGVAMSTPVGVTIVVNGVNDAPSANPDTYTTDNGGSLNVPGPGVLGNDSDPEGNPLTAVLNDPPTHGTVTINPDGSFTYTPQPGFVGNDSFSYRPFDGTAFGNVAAVSIAVTAATPVQIVDFSRYGYHTQPTQLVIRFNQAMDAASLQNTNNYVVFNPGRDNRIGTRDDRRIAVSWASYDPATNSVTLQTSPQLRLRSTNAVVLLGSGIRSAQGRLLDGDGDGVPGGDRTIIFDRRSLAGSVSRHPLRRAIAPRAQMAQSSIHRATLAASRGVSLGRRTSIPTVRPASAARSMESFSPAWARFWKGSQG